MRARINPWILLFAGIVAGCLGNGWGAEAAGPAAGAGEFKPAEEQRTGAYAVQLENWLRDYLVNGYPARAAQSWRRDYRSVESYEKSVEPRREAWRKVLRPPELPKTGAVARAPHPQLAELRAEWLSVPLGGLHAEGLFALPAGADRDHPVPLVIVQHGIGSFPERTFGVMDEGDAYHAFARELVKAGFAVIAPLNLRSVERRNRIERLCRLAGLSLPGIEFVRMQRLLDEVLADPRIDGGRVGMWGLSLGGLATMFWVPVEPRIRVAVVAGWFNHRRNKMAVPDERYSCFLETKEEHAFFQGWLTEFTDSDVASLICPRPLLIQTGKKDRIAWWPMVVEEADAAREHYRRLGLEDRFELDIRDGGHETHLESGLRFLDIWLKPGAGTPQRQGGAEQRTAP